MFVNQSFLRDGLESLVTSNPISIFAETQMGDLLERLYCTGFHHWPVVDHDHKIVGMVTDRDIYQFSKHQNVESASVLRTPVSAFMTDDIETADADSTAGHALETILTHGFHALPVVTNDKLSGMITTTDFTRELAYSPHPARDLTVAQAYDPDPYVVESDMPLVELEDLLRESNRTYVLVSQGDCSLGVITTRDISFFYCRKLARNAYESNFGDSARAVDLLRTTGCIRVTGSLGDAANLMVDQQIPAIMVCEHECNSAGIITEEQILSQLVASDKTLQPVTAAILAT